MCRKHYFLSLVCGRKVSLETLKWHCSYRQRANLEKPDKGFLRTNELDDS